MDSIQDPILREAFKNEQMRIYEKRAREQQSQGGAGSSNDINQYFPNLGGNDDDFFTF